MNPQQRVRRTDVEACRPPQKETTRADTMITARVWDRGRRDLRRVKFFFARTNSTTTWNFFAHPHTPARSYISITFVGLPSSKYLSNRRAPLRSFNSSRFYHGKNRRDTSGLLLSERVQSLAYGTLGMSLQFETSRLNPNTKAVKEENVVLTR
jgi:hypothetical protein